MTASITQTLTGDMAALLGSSLSLQARKRVSSKCDMALNGVFREDGRAKMYVNTYAPGTTINWTISNTTDFKIVQAAADSLIIQALGYNDKVTVKATFADGKTYTLSKEFTSPGIKIYRDGVVVSPSTEVNDIEIELEVRPYGSYEYIKWSQGVGNYMEFTGNTTTTKVKLKGVESTESGSVNVEIKTNGKVYKGSIKVLVRIPTSMSLTTEDRWLDTSEGVLKALVRADIVPKNAASGGAFTWMGLNCSVQSCGADSNIEIDPTIPEVVNPWNPGEYPGVAPGFPGIAVSSAIDPGELSPDMYEALIGERGEENVHLRLAAVMINEEEISSITIGIKDKANEDLPVDNEVEIQEEYITFVSSGTTFPPPGNLHPIPVDNPSYALVRVKPNMTGTVRCTFRLGTQTLTASLQVPYLVSIYHSAYNVGNNSIELARQMEDVQLTDQDQEQDYKACIYNDFGVVKEVSFSSLEEKISIPMHGHGPGNYYLNVRDNLGNVITHQVVPVK